MYRHKNSLVYDATAALVACIPAPCAPLLFSTVPWHTMAQSQEPATNIMTDMSDKRSLVGCIHMRIRKDGTMHAYDVRMPSVL
jgi:hypothetical protein